MSELIHLPWRHVGLPLGDGEGPGIWTSLLPAEAQELARLATGIDVLEVGAAAGFSTVALAQTARSVTSVELAEGWVAQGDVRLMSLRAYGVENVNHVIGSSFDMLPALADTGVKYGLIFLDGDHAFDSITQDAVNSLPLLVPGGVLACHDYLEDCCHDVKPALDRLFPSGPDYTLGTMAVYKK